jgi:hypothetical protein
MALLREASAPPDVELVRQLFAEYARAGARGARCFELRV